MSSEPTILGSVPLEWEHGGHLYKLAAPDLGLELIFQARHEAWARNRIEATKAMVSVEAYLTDVKLHGERVAANHFAFGGRISDGFLLSDAGMTEYIALLSELGARNHGSPPLTHAALIDLRRNQEKAWDELVGKVLRRDRPNWMPEPASQSPAPATLTPSTTASSSSSQAAPG